MVFFIDGYGALRFEGKIEVLDFAEHRLLDGFGVPTQQALHEDNALSLGCAPGDARFLSLFAVESDSLGVLPLFACLIHLAACQLPEE